jgi:hypothetical protein
MSLLDRFRTRVGWGREESLELPAFPGRVPSETLRTMIAQLEGAPVDRDGFTQVNRDGVVWLLKTVLRGLEE